MNCINIDVGSFDLYFKDLAQEVVDSSAEDDLLDALADELRRTAAASGSEVEKAFCLEASARCAALAQWCKENAP